ncbi:MAG: hypothetical protein H7X97_00815, partial [Opitutaceae bacterium]|nr:hypothetical protein [Verrucomicrobiales bacterium]
MRFGSIWKATLLALAFVGMTAEIQPAHGQSQSVSAGALGTQVLNGFQGVSPTTTGHVASASAVWSTYTPPKRGVLQLDTSGSSSDTTLAVYTGASLFKLQEVAYNDDAAAGTKTSLVKIKVEPGTTYRVALDQKPSSSKHVVALNRAFLESETSPAVYSGLVTIQAAALVKADADAPKPAGVECEFVTWQKIKVLREGTFAADTMGSAFNTVLAVYSGAAEGATLKDLKSLASNDDHD